MLLLVEPIFRLEEISFRSRLFLCVATVTVFCTNKLLMQNLIPANKLILVDENHSLHFFQTFFPSSENIFFNESFIPAYFLSSGESVLFYSELFYRRLKPLMKLGETTFKRKTFPANGKHSLQFSCQKKQ